MNLAEITEKLNEVFGGNDSGLDRTFKIDLGDDGAVFIDTTSAPNSVSNDGAEPDVTLTISLADYEQMLNGDLDGQMAFMTGRLKVDGDLSGAIALGSYMGSQD